MSSLLLAESGSTKTDWCLLHKGRKPVRFKTSGINPYLQSQDAIVSLLTQELEGNKVEAQPEAVYFYGAGAGSPRKQEEVKGALRHYFGTKKIEVQGDLMAAARSLCGDKKGVVCILGTGSNSCYYDGKKLKEQQASLGFIAGDEGSGNYMGKRVLQYYAYGTFDEELKAVFETYWGNDITPLLNRLYREPFPNRLLAGFVRLLTENRGHFMVENIIEDSLADFFNHHILKYRQSWKLPLYFTGSVAYEFEDVIRELCNQYELDLGAIVQSPMEGLLRYHKALL
jgi:N-acetylglucosamine kinase-like BadF-type ATPase